MKVLRYLPLVVVTLAILTAAACAAKSPVDKARVGALVFSRAAHDAKVAEDQLYAAKVPGYDQATHFAVQQKLKAVLVAAVAYDDGAKALKPGDPLPQSVVNAGNALVAAVGDLSKSIPKLNGAERALSAVVAGLQTSIATYLSTPVKAEIPGGPIFGLITLLFSYFAQGKVAIADLKSLLKKAGATDDEIAAAEGQVTADIADIDREQANPTL